MTCQHDVTAAEVSSAYRRAAAVVLFGVSREMCRHTTSFAEALFRTLFDCVACGVWVICTDVSGMAEVAADANGFVVPPNDPVTLRQRLRLIVGVADLNQRMKGAAPVDDRNGFTWPAAVEHGLETYSRASRDSR